MCGGTLAGSFVSADGVSFVAAAMEPSNRIAAVVMTTTIEQRALINV